MVGVRLEMLSKVNEGYPNFPLTSACTRLKHSLCWHFLQRRLSICSARRQFLARKGRWDKRSGMIQEERELMPA